MLSCSPVLSQKLLIKGEEVSIKPVEVPIKGGEVSIKPVEVPIKGEEVSIKPVEVPIKCVDILLLCFEMNDLTILFWSLPRSPSASHLH